jgi:hypothetical protein
MPDWFVFWPTGWMVYSILDIEFTLLVLCLPALLVGKGAVACCYSHLRLLSLAIGRGDRTISA